MGKKLVIPVLGMFVWVLSLYAGSFAAAALAYSSGLRRNTYNRYQSKSNELIKIKADDIKDAVEFGETTIGRMGRLEVNLGWADIHVKPGTAAHGQLIENAATEEALELGRIAVIAAKASQHLKTAYCAGSSDDENCIKQLSKYNLKSTTLSDICNTMVKNCSARETWSRYRSFDGSCNNVMNSTVGKTYTPYTRLLFPEYSDGILEPRRSVSRKMLPSPRSVSTKILDNVNYLDPNLTLSFMQWMQFIEHDMVHTASSHMISSNESIICCDKWGSNLTPRFKHPFCMPIEISEDDPFYSKHRCDCMSYVRSLLALKNDCSFGPIEQMNEASHFLDGSQIYGPTQTRAESLRQLRAGKLAVSKKDGKEYLPLSLYPTNDCQVTEDNEDCYRAGDSRVNTHPHVTTMYMLWWREHNRLADALKAINPTWNDEILYQEARRIVIAEMQHITYNEWLPLILGRDYAFSDEYNSSVDPSVSNAFASAAMRFINSLMEANIHIYEENRVAHTTLRLQEHFNKPAILGNASNLDGLIRGLATQRSGKFDLNFVPDVTEQLYKKDKYGYDVLSLDIQRGRDHGLPNYLEYKKLCDNKEINNFNDLKEVMSTERVEILIKIYSSIRDIDLMVGAMAETPKNGDIFGPTFMCIISEQFERTKAGDRYSITNGETFNLNAQQLKEIQKTTLARIFCDNGDAIKKMQLNVFTIITDENKLLNCDDSIPKLDLSAWREIKY